MTAQEYFPTPHLPDEQGKATLSNLWDLYCNIDVDPETRKKVRSGSQAERHAIAELQTAMIKAAVPFEYYYEFNAWLLHNNCDSFVHYHPSHGLSEITHSVRRISQQVADIERRERDTSNTLLEFVLELSRLRKALNIPAAA